MQDILFAAVFMVIGACATGFAYWRASAGEAGAAHLMLLVSSLTNIVGCVSLMICLFRDMMGHPPDWSVRFLCYLGLIVVSGVSATVNKRTRRKLTPSS